MWKNLPRRGIRILLCHIIDDICSYDWKYPHTCMLYKKTDNCHNKFMIISFVQCYQNPYRMTFISAITFYKPVFCIYAIFRRRFPFKIFHFLISFIIYRMILILFFVKSNISAKQKMPQQHPKILPWHFINHILIIPDMHHSLYLQLLHLLFSAVLHGI